MSEMLNIATGRSFLGATHVPCSMTIRPAILFSLSRPLGRVIPFAELHSQLLQKRKL